MGCGESTPEQEIEDQMKHDKKKSKKLIKILLLGPGDSGKTTIVKQMKKIHHGQIDPEELLNFRSLIRKQILDIMSLMSRESMNQKQNLGEDLNKVRDRLAEDMLIEELELIDDVDDIKKLWQQKAFYELRKRVLLPENADYFLDRIDKINEKDYMPSFDDYVRCRVKTTGYNCERFDTKIHEDKVPLELIDVGGQRSERRKWMSLFQNDMDAVLYIFGLGGYDKVLYEDCNVNRLDEALRLFTEVKKIGFLDNKTVVLFFNKYDLFLEKIGTIPITVAFEKLLKDKNPNSEQDAVDYEFPKDKNPNSEEDAVDFVLELFEEIYKREYVKDKRTKEITLVNKNKNKKVNSKRFFMHQTTALDTDLVARLMSSIQLALVMENVGQTGI